MARRKRDREQLDFWGRKASSEPKGRPDLTPTRALLRNPSCRRVLDLVRQVRVFFPELDGIPIRVGLTRAAAGFASRDDSWIWINPYRLSLHTIAHELVHLLQNLGHVPKGEKSADLFALARHRAVADDLPCYLKTPAGLRRSWQVRHDELGRLLHVTARDALHCRDQGVSHYLRWFELELAKRWKGIEPRVQSTEPGLHQGGLFDQAPASGLGRVSHRAETNAVPIIR